MNHSPRPPTSLGVEDRARLAVDAATVADDADLVALVRSAAEALPGNDADLLDLHLRHHFTAAEIGADTATAPCETTRLLARTTRRLGDSVGARILFHGGWPRCSALREVLSSEGITTFGPLAAAVITAHARSCTDCREGSRTRLDPAAMFAAIPVVPAPPAFKARVAATLAGCGVPMGGSSLMAASTGTCDGHGSGWYGSVTPAPLPLPVPSRSTAQPAQPTVEITTPAPAAPAAAGTVAVLEAPPWRDVQVLGLSDRQLQRRPPRRGVKALLAAAASATLLTGAVAVAANGDRPLADAVAAPETAPSPAPDPELDVVGPDEAPRRGPEADPPEQGPGMTKPDPGHSPGTDDEDSDGSRDPGGRRAATGPTFVSFELSDGAVTSGTSVKAMPELTWEVQGPGSVKVSGAGVSSESMSGSEVVCPGTLSGGRCWCEGSFDYTITLRDADGDVVKTVSRTLTMKPAPDSPERSGPGSDTQEGGGGAN